MIYQYWYDLTQLQKSANWYTAHSISAMSENYVVFIEQPIKMDLLKIVTGKLRGKGISDGVYWDPKLETIFHLINKQTGKVRPWYRKPWNSWSLSISLKSFGKRQARNETTKDTKPTVNTCKLHASFLMTDILYSLPALLSQVSRQSAVHVPPDQCLGGEWLPGYGPLCRRWWQSHQQLHDSEHAQVRRGSRRG